MYENFSPIVSWFILGYFLLSFISAPILFVIVMVKIKRWLKGRKNGKD